MFKIFSINFKYNIELVNVLKPKPTNGFKIIYITNQAKRQIKKTVAHKLKVVNEFVATCNINVTDQYNILNIALSKDSIIVACCI